MKVALAQFIYESNTFNSQKATLSNFTDHGVWLTESGPIREWAHSNRSQMAGSLDELAAIGCQTDPFFVATCSTPGGRLSRKCYAQIRSTFTASLKQVSLVDVLLLHLHGAVCSEGESDVEGDLLEMIRGELGFKGRVVLSLDLHANVTERMLQQVDASTAYRTFPHQDFYETGQRAARLCLGPQPLTQTIATLPCLISPTATDHRAGPFAAMLDAARELETESDFVDVSLFPVQPWLDIDNLTTRVVINSLSPEAGVAAAQQLAEQWFAQRQSWDSGLIDWPQILTALASPANQPWLLVDTADATTGGSDGTSAEAITRLWPHREKFTAPIFLWVVDPAAVKIARSGPSTFELGLQKITVSGDVIFEGECRFSPRGQAYQGQEFSCGEAVVIRSGCLRIVITEQGCLCADPAFYECLNLDPSAALAVLVKSHMGWQAGYEVGPERGLKFDGPGCTSLNFARLHFTGPRRDLFPINPVPFTPIKLWQST